MARFENLFGNFVMIGLMVLALFSLIIAVQMKNDAAQPIIEDDLFNSTYGLLQGNISSLENTSKDKYHLFSAEKPAPGIFSIVLFTIVNIGRTFGDIMFVMFAVIIKLPLVVLGIPQTVIAMILSFLTISIIIAVWIVYKFGG